VISRRAVLGTAVALGGVGVAGGAARRAGVLDDGLRAVGIRPHATPDPRDVQLLAEAANGQRTLVAQFDALVAGHDVTELAPLRAVLTEQLAAVSDNKDVIPIASSADDRDAALNAFARQVEEAASARRDGALSAGSLAVTQVLASMSAGLSQVAVAVRDAA